MSEEGVERRLTTILAADVVGYSRLMAADEAGTLAQLKTHRKELIEPKTAEYHGRVVKLMGDGTETNPAIKPYSNEVAPPSSPAKREGVCFPTSVFPSKSRAHAVHAV